MFKFLRFHISRFLFSRYGRGSRNSRKFGPRENFPLYGTFQDSVLVPLPEIQLLGEHGVMLPPNMQGLTEEQVEELKLVDEYKETCIPSGGFVVNPDPVGRRNGRGKMKTLQLVE